MKKIFTAIIVFISLLSINVYAYSGWKTIDGNKYYYENNVKVTGIKSISGKTYYFNSKGILQKNKLLTINEEIYYATSDGSFAHKWQTLNNKRYYFDNTSGKAFKGYHTIDGKVYYFYSGSGVLRTGFHTIRDNLHYSNSDGTVKTGWLTKDGKKYYFNKSYPYEAYKGYHTISGNIYYFYNGSGVLRIGFHDNGKRLFYSNSEGIVQKGWQTISGKTYYFSETSPYESLRGYQTIDDKLYYFYNGSGVLRKGFHDNGTRLFYSNNEGIVQKGWQTINGKTYYFSETSPYESLRGYQTINGNRYYFYTGSGVLRRGFHTIRDNLFYSNENGIVQTGWQTIDGKTYYFNETSYEALRGYQTIDGNLYYFYNGSAVLRRGFHDNGTRLFYSNSDGIVQKGWQTISGKTYYFSETSPYEAYSGVREVDGNLYYFNPTTRVKTVGWAGSGITYYHSGEDGILDTGLVTIGDTKYKFNSQGKLLGFSKKDNKVYYTNPDGKVVKGTIRMCNKYFKFDELDGHFIKIVNKKSVIDVSVHNGTIDWKTIKYSGEVDAVILRIGYASQNEDANFKKNVEGLKKYKIPYSVYLFSYAENEAEALSEAKFVVKTLKKYDCKLSSNIPIFYDLEPWSYKENGQTISSSSISNATYGKMIKKFVNYIETNYNKKTRVYASRDYITSRFPEAYQKYATWVAAWVANLNYSGPYEGWQYTSDGKVAGISGRVDMSWFYY